MPGQSKVSQTTRSQEEFKQIARKFDTPDVVAKGVIGQLKHWREDRGFGFISVSASSKFTEQDQVFCHLRALDRSVQDTCVVRFDVLWKYGKFEASNVRRVSEFEVMAEDLSGKVQKWDSSRELGWIQDDSDKSWVRFSTSECLDDDVWVGLPVQFNLCRSVMDPDRICAQKVRALPTEVIVENLKGKVKYVSVSGGYGWIVSGKTDFKFFTHELVSEVTKGATVCFDHVRVGDVDLAARVSLKESAFEDSTMRALKQKPAIADEACGVLFKGWISRTFKTAVAGEEVEHVVLSAFACDQDFICRASNLVKGDLVDFELEWNSFRKIWPINMKRTGSSNQVPLCACGGRHLVSRCPARQLLRLSISEEGGEEFVHVAPKTAPKVSRGKIASDQMSSCSTAAPLSELHD